MAKKPSKTDSNKPWACPKGCKLTKFGCPHLDKLMPGFNKPIYGVEFNENYHRAPEAVKYVSPEEREASFRKWIAQYALPAEAVEFLVARMIDDKTLEQVAKEQNFTDKQAAHRFEKWIKQTLVDRGLKPKGKSNADS